MTEVVKNKMKRPAPRYMYKFRSWSNPKHRTILTERKIWFTSPRSFNDPFDCRILFRFDKLTYEDHKENAIKFQVDSGEIKTPEEIEQYAVEMATYWSNLSDSERQIIYSGGQRWLEENRGVFTLSATPDNILMWSHYSDSHKGFCVEFDTLKLVPHLNQVALSDKYDTSCHSVEYQDEYPILVPSQRNPRDYFRNLLVKSSQWKYEEEYRIISYLRTDFGVGFDSGIITKVILGCQMSDSDCEEVIHELIKLGDQIPLVRAKVKDEHFGLDFEDVPY